MIDFVNLNTTTAYSLGYSLIKPEELSSKVKEFGQPAVALTDFSLAGIYDAYLAAKKENIKFIPGCQFNFVDNFEQESRFKNITLLAKNHNGYKNLLHLNKLGFDNSIVAFKRVYPRINWKMLEGNSKDLICLTGGSTGILGQLLSNRKTAEAKEIVVKLQDIFGDNLGLEIQANNMKRPANNYNNWLDQDITNRQVISLGKELSIRIVPTNPAAYLVPEHFEAMDVFLAMTSSQPIRSNARPKFTQNEFYLKTGDQVRQFFSRHHPNEIDSWIANTVYFANQCESDTSWILPITTNISGTELPDFPVKDQEDYSEFLLWKEKYSESDELPEPFRFTNDHKIDGIYLRFWCWKNFDKRLPYLQENQKQEYYNQIKEEISVFEYKNICNYLLIVADYLSMCHKTGIPAGPGRGSIGGSLCAYLMEIHEADPIKYNLIFERFYNREKIEFSDIDCDFSQAGKKQVEVYIANKYGHDHVCSISNFISLSPKPYAKAIARVFQYGGDRKSAVKVGNDIAGFISPEAKKIEEVLKTPIFQELDKKYPELKKFSSLLGGRAVSLAKHAGGCCISRRPLHEIVPTRRDKDGGLVIEFEKERTEKNGLQKLDILGVSSLDQIQDTLFLIKKRNKLDPDFSHYNDVKTYELIGRGDTFGVFQFGASAGTISLCKKIEPKNIDDLAQINALARPGFPPEIRDDFIKAKKENSQAAILHPSMERALGSTFGFPLFEECLMYLAIDTAGWSKLEADRLRKFVKDKGKHPEKGPILRKEFIEGAVNNKGIDKKLATRIWDEVIANFEGYSFNRSHAILYSFLGYRTAYLKAHYPVEFLVANLNFESGSLSPKATDNINQIKYELRAMGVSILPPDLNTSEMNYTIIDEKTVRIGLGSLKFIGKDAPDEIISKRPFKNLSDFLSRVDNKKVRAPSVQALAAAGCLDIFGQPRKQIFLYAGDYKKKLQVWNKKERSKELIYPWPDEGEFSIPEKYALEKIYLGEGLSGTLYQIYPGFFSNRAADFSQLPSFYPENMIKDAGFVRGRKKNFPIDGTIQAVVKDYHEWIVTKELSQIVGQTMARMSLADPYGNVISGILFPETLKKFRTSFHFYCGPKAKIETGVVFHLAADANWYEGNFGLIITDLRKAALTPVLPPDIKPKSVALSLPRSKKKNPTVVEVLEEVEDQIDFEGLIEESMDILQNSDIEENFEF